jgi:hypothetical protein
MVKTGYIMNDETPRTPTVSPFCTAFMGGRRVASGPLPAVAVTVKELVEREQTSPVLVFDDETSAVIDLDLRGSIEDVERYAATLARAQSAGPADPDPVPFAGRRGPGRPRLGVVAREVTLLPRHWDWLNEQPGGASAALRRLVDEARRTHAGRDRIRRAQEAAYRFMSAMAGDEPGFEEATRALFAGNRAVFDALIAPWPPDVRDHARKLADPALAGGIGA